LSVVSRCLGSFGRLGGGRRSHSGRGDMKARRGLLAGEAGGRRGWRRRPAVVPSVTGQDRRRRPGQLREARRALLGGVAGRSPELDKAATEWAERFWPMCHPWARPSATRCPVRIGAQCESVHCFSGGEWRIGAQCESVP
jgi:hypothetical protein